MTISGDSRVVTCRLAAAEKMEARKWRLFVGNLSETVKQDELREKFELLVVQGSRSYQNQEEVRVGNVEIRCKNQDNYFGFVDIHGLGANTEAVPPPHLHKVIDLMNNTKWKGNLIKVQLAKESFLDKLRRERAGGASVASTIPSGVDVSQHQLPANLKLQSSVRRFTAPKRPDNFDFEIVSNSAVGTRKTFPGDDGGRGGQESDGDNEDAHDEFHDESGIPKFKGLAAFGFGQPQQPSDTLDSHALASIGKQISNKSESTDPRTVINQEDLARFERLQRIAGYPIAVEGSEISTGSQNHNFNLGRKQHQRFETTNQEQRQSSNTSADVPKGVVFRKHKQQNSDLLRQQSLHKMKDIKAQQHNIIKTSLAQSNISNNFGNSSEESLNSRKSPKKQKMNLFGDDDDDEDMGNEFQLKKQYEGSAGQRLLELRGQWAFDERFKIDERFKGDEDGEGVTLPADEEKRNQMMILSDVLGTRVTLQPKAIESKNKREHSSNSVLINRYDPDLDPDPTTTIPKSVEMHLEEDSKKSKSSKKLETPKEPLIRSSEPATYKTVSNLKALFSSEHYSSEKPKDCGFSLLATFGEAQLDKDEPDYYEQSTASSGAPRQFWESNPFKYDSSDDEDDDGTSKRKKNIVPPAITKCEFFFHKNDSRFAGLDDYFLKRDVMDMRIDYDEKRRELRSIVKAKARNAKRKDEKRTVAIKRAIRKKRKYRITQIKSGSSNAMKLGGSV